ncbi:MAG: cell division protein ZapB [Enterobacteriaceae bacterium]
MEGKVQQALDTIALLRMEVEELKEQKSSMSHQMQEASGHHDQLVQENEQLKQEQALWQERLRTLLGKMEEV